MHVRKGIQLTTYGSTEIYIQPVEKDVLGDDGQNAWLNVYSCGRFKA